jgi:hypothetical protein
MSDNKTKLEDYYEDAGDPLATFRAINGGGFIEKNGKDPFAKDVDILQSERTQKMEDDFRNAGF